MNVFYNKIFSINLKKFIIILFFFLFYSTLTTNIALCAHDTVIPILTYHNFTTGESSSYRMNIDKFTKQMDYLATNGYSVISMSELLERFSNNTLPSNPVVITIDDGYKATYTLAYPILKKYQFPATIFIYSDFIEKNTHSLTWKEIQIMAENNIEIGSHTISHCNLLKRINGETETQYLHRIIKEISLSKEILENKTRKEVKYFAYPYGAYDSEMIQIAVQAGYQGIVNANNMNNDSFLDKLSLNRQIIFGQYTQDDFIGLLSQKPLPVVEVFPEDGAVSSNQLSKIGAVFKESIDPNSIFSMKLGGAKVKYGYDLQNHKISFTPQSLKPLIKKSYIVSITAHNNQNELLGKTSWLITIK